VVSLFNETEGMEETYTSLVRGNPIRTTT
jgi:hypothetical protein